MARAAARRRPAREREAPGEAAQARRTRALEEPLDVSWIATEPYRIAVVRNPLHGTRYRVYAPDLAHLDAALCTCPDFAHRGAETCKHLEAIRLGRDTREAPAPATGGSPGDAHAAWEAIARRRASYGRARLTLAELRQEGRLLIDGPDRPADA